jgi:hypothetical protein
MKKPNLWIRGIEEREEIQTKGIDNLLSKIIAKNFPNLKKEKTIRCKKLREHETIRIKKRNTPRHIRIKTFNIQNKERILKAAKKKRQVTYKSKHPLQ